MEARTMRWTAALFGLAALAAACDMASVEPGRDGETLWDAMTLGQRDGGAGPDQEVIEQDGAVDDAGTDAAPAEDGGGVYDAGPPPDAGGADAARDDAGVEDAGVGDAAGGGDDGFDGGADDTGTVDASVQDASVDPKNVTCAVPPPPGADLPDPLPAYTGGACPDLQPGRNALTSSGAAREFLLLAPANLDPSESLPVLFLWHWLGGSAEDFIEKGEIQLAADQLRLVAAIPESKGDLSIFGFDPQWPYLFFASDERLEEEAVFFDDMLACIAAKYNVNTNCVSSAGVSSGALFTDQLAQVRSRRLASFLSLSGGVGTGTGGLDPRAAVRPWTGADHKLPALVLWGGPSDWCGINFEASSKLLEDALVAGGHYFIECVHNCKHAEPPTSPPAGESRYSGLWRFFLDHPFWLRDGESPYQLRGLPANLPEWCGVGAGSAKIREGECEGGGIAGQCF
ncbi:MAG: hypothetical protein HY897_12880 [Deltaproteobacteria bacterium]|nr:hypothetical protein [Deltaproteobacteria bacterium]